MPVYFIQAENGLIKIGKARHERALINRVRQAETMSPIPVTLLGIIPNVHQDYHYHYQFAHLRQYGEWFKPGQDLLDFIAKETVKYELEQKVCRECGSRVISKSKYCPKHQKLPHLMGK